MRILLVWLLLFLVFIIYIAYDANKRYDELKKQHQELMGEFEA
jgi:cbb3-type cytochrome oxidase subunit 3